MECSGHMSFLVFWSFIYLFFCFLWPYPRHMEVPRLGVQSELQQPAYTTATATQNLSHVCDLHHSSRQHQILNRMREARGRTCNPMVSSWIHFHCATTRTPGVLYNKLDGMYIFKILFFFFFLMATPMAYGSFQVRG